MQYGSLILFIVFFFSMESKFMYFKITKMEDIHENHRQKPKRYSMPLTGTLIKSRWSTARMVEGISTAGVCNSTSLAAWARQSWATLLASLPGNISNYCILKLPHQNSNIWMIFLMLESRAPYVLIASPTKSAIIISSKNKNKIVFRSLILPMKKKKNCFWKIKKSSTNKIYLSSYRNIYFKYALV
jgi:hypothetical protein